MLCKAHRSTHAHAYRRHWLQVPVRGGASLRTKPGRVRESVPYLAPVPGGRGGVSKVLSWEGGGEEWGCVGAGEVTPGDLNYAPPGAPDLLSRAETQMSKRPWGHLRPSCSLSTRSQSIALPVLGTPPRHPPPPSHSGGTHSFILSAGLNPKYFNA